MRFYVRLHTQTRLRLWMRVVVSCTRVAGRDLRVHHSYSVSDDSEPVFVVLLRGRQGTGDLVFVPLGNFNGVESTFGESRRDSPSVSKSLFPLLRSPGTTKVILLGDFSIRGLLVPGRHEVEVLQHFSLLPGGRDVVLSVVNLFFFVPLCPFREVSFGPSVTHRKFWLHHVSLRPSTCYNERVFQSVLKEKTTVQLLSFGNGEGGRRPRRPFVQLKVLSVLISVSPRNIEQKRGRGRRVSWYGFSKAPVFLERIKIYQT